MLKTNTGKYVAPILETDFRSIDHGERMEFAQEIAKLISQMVNNLTFRANDFVSEVKSETAIENMRRLSWCWVESLKLQAELNLYDDRNEYSVQQGDVLSRLSCMDELSPKKTESDSVSSFFHCRKPEFLSVEYYICMYLSREHRTLQQSWSSIVFAFLNTYFREEHEFQELGDYWYECPMI